MQVKARSKRSRPFGVWQFAELHKPSKVCRSKPNLKNTTISQKQQPTMDVGRFRFHVGCREFFYLAGHRLRRNDDDIALFVSRRYVAVRVADLFHRIAAVNDGFQMSCFDELCEKREVLGFLF